MLAEPWAQWVFTALFAALAVFACLRMVLDRGRPVRFVGHGLHLVMTLGMVAMTWPWWSAIPVALQLAVFGAATVWFAGLGVGQVLRRIPGDAVGGHSPWHQLAHAVMMAAMVWMVAVMAGAPTTSATGHTHAPLGPAAVLTGVAATAGLVVTSVVMLVDATQYPRSQRNLRGKGAEAVAGASMGGAMASLCWLMLAH